ncbi:MAG: flavodoxin family protein [Candidatus Latescibacterota bacterium]
MTIVGVISSLNYDGNSATLLREALRGAAEEGASVREIFLPQYTIEFCNGCNTCMATGTCRHADDFGPLKAQLAAADGIILSSPTYAATCSAMMKRFLERIGMFERFTSSVFGGKYVAAISTGKIMGAGKVAGYLAGLGRDSAMQRGYVSGALGVILRGGKTAAENPDALRKARSLGKKIAGDVKKKRTYPLQNPFGRMLHALFLRRFFKKAAVDYKDGPMKGVYENLRGRGLVG